MKARVSLGSVRRSFFARKAQLAFAASMTSLALLPACTDPSRDATRSLAAAVSRYRLADDAEKRTRISDISRVPCPEPDVCDARDTCVRMAEEWDHSLVLRVTVKQALAELDNHTLSKDDPRAQALPGLLDESEAALTKAHALSQACDEKLAAVSAKHK